MTEEPEATLRAYGDEVIPALQGPDSQSTVSSASRP